MAEENYVTDDEKTFQVRLDSVKKAALVLNALADSFKDAEAKSETKSLAWAVTWAVKKLEKSRSSKKVA